MISAEKGITGFACLFNAEICLAAIEIDVSLTIIDSVVNFVYIQDPCKFILTANGIN